MQTLRLGSSVELEMLILLMTNSQMGPASKTHPFDLRQLPQQFVVRLPNYCGLLAPDILVSPKFSACNWELRSLKNKSFFIKSCTWGEMRGGNIYHVSHMYAAHTLRPWALETQLISYEQVELNFSWE